MSSNYDIKMNLDETLELDAIIQNWNAESDDTINVTDGTYYNLSGFQTHTGFLTLKNREITLLMLMVKNYQ